MAHVFSRSVLSLRGVMRNVLGNSIHKISNLSMRGSLTSYTQFATLILSLLIATSAGASEIVGKILSVVDQTTNFRISGWACQTGVDASIDVHLYAGGAAGYGGQMVVSAPANGLSDLEVNATCGTRQGGMHNFTINLSREKYLPFIGKSIFVHGIREVGTIPNAAIANSGRFVLPSEARYNLAEKMAFLEDGDLTINAGERVTINTNIDVGILRIEGKLLCPSAGEYVINSQGIIVEGSGSLLQCGSAAGRFAGRLSIVLKPGQALGGMGERAFAAMHGGTIRLFGDGRGAGWTKLGATIAACSVPGSVPCRTLHLEVATNWRKGDRIVIGPTGFNPSEAEEKIITDISGTLVTVDSDFKFSHYGVRHSYTNTTGTNTWLLDERAEVANLTRNIKIVSAGTEAELDFARIGGHMMTMAKAYAYVDGVEFVRMGQMGVLGRYPFHWHLAGYVGGPNNTTGQFIKNSSIRNSYQRCLSIHGTHGALVENNVCFNHFGHGYFLENGGETNNSLIHNLSMLSKRIPLSKAILISDAVTSNFERFAPSSGFWISNPNNIVSDNVVSGAQGTGFWMAFSQKLICTPATNDCYHPGSVPPSVISRGLEQVAIYPARVIQKGFSNNVAHSARVGMTWDGAPDGVETTVGLPTDLAHYQPKRHPDDRVIVLSHYLPKGRQSGEGLPIFNNLRAYKNIVGLYYRGATAQYNNLIAADNGVSLFFAFNQLVTNSLVVALSPNKLNADLLYLKSLMRVGQRMHGIRLYDGPFDLQNVHFANFIAMQPIDGWDASPVPFLNVGGVARYTNSVRQITFSPQPFRKFEITPSSSQTAISDSVITSAIRDIDGSLCGLPAAANRVIVPVHAFNNDSTCAPIVGESALRCHYQIGTLSITGRQGTAANLNVMKMTVHRIKPATSTTPLQIVSFAATPGAQFNKMNMIFGRGYIYQVNFASGFAPTHLGLKLFTDRATVMSPVVKFVGLPSSCNLDAGIAMPSLQALNALDSSFSGTVAYYKAAPTSTEVSMRFNPKKTSLQITSAYGTKDTTSYVEFCN